MPTYEYRCKQCSHQFEQLQSIKDEPLKTCPQCGGPVERLICAGAGFIFKGSGFYITDYRSESYKKGANADKGAEPTVKSDKSSTKPAGADKKVGTDK
ncbi:MAG: FmdB family zinc ribbon protein [Candidatus Latescibacterota bacterium]